MPGGPRVCEAGTASRSVGVAPVALPGPPSEPHYTPGRSCVQGRDQERRERVAVARVTGPRSSRSLRLPAGASRRRSDACLGPVLPAPGHLTGGRDAELRLG